nr:MAG TPA: hypothetical protein [Caudoviricetes sp.]
MLKILKKIILLFHIPLKTLFFKGFYFGKRFLVLMYKI